MTADSATRPAGSARVALPSPGALYWRARLARWPRRQGQQPGYTVLVPVPGDLPVFLELALTVLASQESAHRVRTIVIPDQDTDAVRAIVARRRGEWNGPLDLLLLPRPERWVLPRLHNPSRNHGLQLLTGIGAAASTHVVFHDADLFLLDAGALDEQYVACRDRGLACLGVDPVWDPWFARHDRHLAATWELCARVDWLRAWRPHRHIGHDASLWGERHTFDTTLWAQAHTEPTRIGVRPVPGGVVHFNYVISTYRQLQRVGAGMLDDRFRVLLVRVLVDLFGHEVDGAPDVPTMHQLAAGLDGTGVVRFPAAGTADDDYRQFRRQLGQVLAGPWASASRRAAADRALAPFDAHYRCAPA